MAHAASLDSTALDEVARQVGERIADIAEPALLNVQPIELRESFEVWMLGLDALTSGVLTGKILSQLARPTGRWHHQITFGAYPARAEAFARSSASSADGGRQTLEELFLSPLAAQIDQAIEWVDQNTTGDPLVRLLTVPAYYLHALWLTEDTDQSSRVLVVDVAGAAAAVGTLVGASAGAFYRLRKNQLHDELVFLTTLAQTPPALGVFLGGSAAATAPALPAGVP